jgi:hypothetical protein
MDGKLATCVLLGMYLGACGDTASRVDPAEGVTDAEVEVDASVRADAADAAGPSSDAAERLDAMTPPDATLLPDTTTLLDAASPPDAAVPPGAAVPPDAASPQGAAVPQDAAIPPDAAVNAAGLCTLLRTPLWLPLERLGAGGRLVINDTEITGDLRGRDAHLRAINAFAEVTGVIAAPQDELDLGFSIRLLARDQRTVRVTVDGAVTFGFEPEPDPLEGTCDPATGVDCGPCTCQPPDCAVENAGTRWIADAPLLGTDAYDPWDEIVVQAGDASGAFRTAVAHAWVRTGYVATVEDGRLVLYGPPGRPLRFEADPVWGAALGLPARLDVACMPDGTGCSPVADVCGNGVCGRGEDPYNCLSDCRALELCPFVEGVAPIAGGRIGADDGQEVSINGWPIPDTEYLAGDADGALVRALTSDPLLWVANASLTEDGRLRLVGRTGTNHLEVYGQAAFRGLGLGRGPGEANYGLTPCSACGDRRCDPNIGEDALRCPADCLMYDAPLCAHIEGETPVMEGELRPEDSLRPMANEWNPADAEHTHPVPESIPVRAGDRDGALRSALGIAWTVAQVDPDGRLSATTTFNPLPLGATGPNASAVSGWPEGNVTCPGDCAVCPATYVDGFHNSAELCAWRPRGLAPAGGRLSNVDSLIINGVEFDALEVEPEDADGALFDALQRAAEAGQFTVIRGDDGAHRLLGWPGQGLTVEARGDAAAISGLQTGSAACPGPECGQCLTGPSAERACVDFAPVLVPSIRLNVYDNVVINGRTLAGLDLAAGDATGAFSWAIRALDLGLRDQALPFERLHLWGRPGRIVEVSTSGNGASLGLGHSGIWACTSAPGSCGLCRD